MNKFTRSQMGKIMACALSAAMAVTVVPTYMKPMTVFAATVVADESELDSLAEEYYIAKVGVANDDVKVYCSTKNLEDDSTYAATANGVIALIDDGTSGLTSENTKEMTVTKIETGTDLYVVLNKNELISGADIYCANDTSDAGTVAFAKNTDFDETKYYVINTTVTADAIVSLQYTVNDATPKTITPTGTVIVAENKIYVPADDIDVDSLSLTAGDSVKYEYKIDSGDFITFATITASEEAEIGDPTTIQQGKVLYSYGVTNTTEVKLFANVGDEEPAYTLKAVDYNRDGNYEIVVPYTVATGKYFMDEATLEAPVLEVTAGSAITGVTLNATNTNIYYFGANGADGSNTETITVDLKGDSDKTILGVDVDASAVSDYFTVNQVNDTTLEVTMKSGLSATEVEEASGKIRVKVYVAGRTSAYDKTITVKAVKGSALSSITMSVDKEIVTTNTDVTFKTTTNATEEKVAYTLATNTAGITSVTGTDGVITLKNSANKTLATFDTATGVLNAKDAATYTVTANGSITTLTPATKSVTVISPTIATVAGEVGAKSGNAINVAGLPTGSYVTYTVEDTDIATIAGLSTNAASTTVNFVKPGITKVTASIVSYTTDKAYDFEASGYIVVAPKDTEDFEITSIPDVEIYANELAANDLLKGELPLQLAEGIVDGKINAKALSADAYELAEDELKDEYSNYYDVNTADDGVTAIGLLFATYDSKVTDVEDPEDRVSVALEISDLQAKDQKYNVKDSVVNFVAEATLDGDVVELNQPVWLTVTNDNLEDGVRYTVYDDGEAIFVADADGTTLTFQTTSFSVFSIVATPDATKTDNSVDLGDKDNTSDLSDIYDKVNFVAHVQRRIGTDDKADIEQTLSEDGVITIGTHGQSRRIEKITLTGLDAEDVEMTAHVQKRVDHPEDIADLTQVVNEDGSISIGTEHQSRRIEAFSMKLKGDLAEQYDVYYRVHAQNYGWLGWAKNGETAGTSGHSFRLEGIEIIFVEKGTEFDETQYAKTTEEGDRGYAGQAAYMDRK